ncbi:hypothetical protein [Pseudomonas phage vB_PaeM_PAO1_Ab17]|uniref:Uncharacterized protein n=2 Tax=Nankokuvirus Ab03 TaxID=1925780 RepID=A0A0A1IUJ4_9CAUD|nr:hypothetical protein VC54_gp104 [Pseudomonas phage vB_PaeM_PAO1_Ab03]CEF89212.1 hypothetical protein [Pseudomonas phage vB_PaeM_PAO1_Ab03]CEF89588.1 hypothetical protein [Pseudomonas phage vB_PaeM_PAO1_Ab17]
MSKKGNTEPTGMAVLDYVNMRHQELEDFLLYWVENHAKGKNFPLEMPNDAEWFEHELAYLTVEGIREA